MLKTNLNLENHRNMPGPNSLPRLLTGLDGGVVTLEDHMDIWGELPIFKDSRTFIELLDESGLRGHGGAWFLVGAKWRSILNYARSNNIVIIGNATEGEPGSKKDKLLVTRAPHLVIDGLMLAAAALKTSDVFLCVDEGVASFLKSELNKRQKLKMDRVRVKVISVPSLFISGEESALANYINGNGVGIPLFKSISPIREKGAFGKPTLVQNVETLAQVAVLARFGAHNFRALGSKGGVGTGLMTVIGGVKEPGVVEISLGSPLKDAIDKAGGLVQGFESILIGGYGGAWIDGTKALELSLTEQSLQAVGGTLGAGIIGVLPNDYCPLGVTARIVDYLTKVRARQCGPCEFGLPLISATLHQLAIGRRTPNLVNDLLEWCALVESRGNCKHPDGVARLVRSTLKVFKEDIDQHLKRGSCKRRIDPMPFPIPNVSIERHVRNGLDQARKVIARR